VTKLAHLRFDPPGPGSWQIDRTHAPRPWARFQTEIHPEQLARGFRETGRRYGLLLDYLDFQFVNGFAYVCPRPVAASEVPERFGAAAEVFERKLWREDLRHWDEEVKPGSIRAHLALQAIDPATLESDALLSHLDRCREHLKQMIYQHHYFNGAMIVPLGDFLARAGEWTGLATTKLLALMRGAAPVSVGASDELDRLVDAIRADRRARALLDSEREPTEVLAVLGSRKGAAGPAARTYVETVGYRLLDGFDVGEPYALEMPELLVGRIRSAVEESTAAPYTADLLAEETAKVRDLVPATERPRFDELLAEARHTYRLRGERGTFGDGWAVGITRRAILEAGARLARKELVEEPRHLVEAGYDEMRALIRGPERSLVAELAERARYRATARAVDAPDTLGLATVEPPPLDGLPAATVRAMRALDVFVGGLFGDSDAQCEPRLVRGLAASPGVYEGTARLIGAPTELGRVHQGDVLVTQSTSEAFNIALPLLGAIVTDSGGLLSHAAIVAREYGIPSVVGTREATAIIPEGARVRVDGSAGEVAVMS
jgi:rifampicin phosphotransferase